MTGSNNLVAQAERQSVTGDGNLTIGGDVDGDIVVTLAEKQEVVQIYGDGNGYRDLIVRDEIDPSHVAWLKERFAEPDEFPGIVSSLLEHKILFLRGQARTGRWTVGVCALAKASGIETPTINVIDVDEGTQLALRRIAPDAHVLLDLTTAAGDALDAVETQLKHFLGTIADAKAHLVVLLPEPPPPGLQAFYQNRIKPITAPTAENVLRKHLTAAGLNAEDVLDDSAITTALVAARPSDAARLADLLAQEYRLADKTEGDAIKTVISKAVRAYGNWSADLISTYDKVEDPSHRSLLLTVALLNNSTTETQYWAERVLLKIAGYPVVTGNLLEGRGFAGRLTELDGVSFGDDRAWFNRLEYDRSVLQHVWSGYPELRRKLVDWVIELGLSQQTRLSGEAASRMVDRFMDLCAAQGVVKYISQVAKHWAESGKAAPARLAVRLLTAGAMDERSAAVVHRQLNVWAGKADLDPALVDLVLAVCGSEFGRKYTDKALTRLGNLADHRERAVSDKVVAAVVAIVQDNRAFPQVLTKLDEWLRGTKERQKAVAVRILRELFSPGADALEPRELTTIDWHSHQEALVRVWRAVLLVEDRALVRAAIGNWLDMATNQDRRDPLLDVLVEAAAAAADAQIDRIGALRWAAEDWLGVVPRYWPTSDDTDERSAVHHALVLKIQACHPFQVTPESGREL